MRVWSVVGCIAASIAALGACSSDSGDVTGPFTGDTHRFVIDIIQIPRDGTEAAMLGADLDGDGSPENAFGNVTGVLAGTNDLSPDGANMIASGALASVVSIQADDLVDDDSVGVAYFGAMDAPATIAGGRLTTGSFTSNRTRDTRAPGKAQIRLPIYVNADPLVLELEGMEIEMRTDGHGGFTGIVRGGIREEVARDAAYTGLIQMFETEPERHLVFGRGIDKDHDDVITRAEVDDSVIALLVSADVDLFDGDRFAPQPSSTPDCLSVAFGIHLKPCPDGLCSTLPPTNTCRDRARDGDETDIDCGGSCQPCAHDKQCARAEDCQSRACDAGTCRAATCTDAVRDGFESDVDCGGSCPKCTGGLTCAADWDCASNNCDNGIASLGTCQGP
ncbi:MAG TPA: hypothetical protein VIV40_40250 [Kofleriaceae bacterium]